MGKSHDIPILSRDSINDDCSSLRARPKKNYLVRLKWKTPKWSPAKQWWWHFLQHCNSIIVGKSFEFEHSADSSNELPVLHITQTLALRCMLQWPPACLHKVLPRRPSKAKLKKTPNERRFEDFVCVLKLIFLALTKKSMLVLGSYRKDRKYSKDKTNIDNRKVNTGGPHSQPTAPKQSIWKIHHIPLAVYHAGGFDAMTQRWVLHDIHSYLPIGLIEYVQSEDSLASAEIYRNRKHFYHW